MRRPQVEPDGPRRPAPCPGADGDAATETPPSRPAGTHMTRVPTPCLALWEGECKQTVPRSAGQFVPQLTAGQRSLTPAGRAVRDERGDRPEQAAQHRQGRPAEVAAAG